MRFDVRFLDRIGIAQEILAVLSGRGIYVIAVEVDQHHVYVDAPSLGPGLEEVRGALLRVPGVVEVTPIDLLPGARERLHLDALFASMVDPVLAVDRNLVVTAANRAAGGAAASSDPRGSSVGRLFGDAELEEELKRSGFRVPLREVTFRGGSYFVEATPLREGQGAAGGGPAGGVLTLHSARRVGDRLQAIQSLSSGAGFDDILGASPPMRALKARAARVAGVQAPLLIRGETGSGKELVAHACHRASPRGHAPFLVLNCAALPESLAESELFGYAPGSFTGAHRGGKPGLLEMADRGTIFLDEIGEMSPYLQAKILRFLSDGSFRRVGGDRELRVDVRVVSATHRDLEAMVEAKSFREDLFYRLNVVNLDVPPLRERGQDILLLARHFLARAGAQVQRPAGGLTAAAEAALLADPWPGNVRQLHNVVFRAVTLSDRATLDVTDLDLAGARAGGAWPLAAGAGAEVGSWTQALAAFERTLLSRLYPLYPSSRKLAARLGTSHNMIAKKLRAHGVGPRRPREP